MDLQIKKVPFMMFYFISKLLRLILVVLFNAFLEPKLLKGSKTEVIYDKDKLRSTKMKFASRSYRTIQNY